MASKWWPLCGSISPALAKAGPTHINCKHSLVGTGALLLQQSWFAVCCTVVKAEDIMMLTAGLSQEWAAETGRQAPAAVQQN